jgi:hypothetical protein
MGLRRVGTHDGRADRRLRLDAAIAALLVAACALASCGSSASPARRASSRSTTSSSTTTTTLPVTSTTLRSTPGVAVPDVIGLKITPARFFLRVAGFFTVPFNVPCNKGTLTSQSVVAALSIPGKAPQLSAGAVPLLPGTVRPKGSFVGITWSGCYPNGSIVPNITGLTFWVAAKLVHVAGLTWACYSVGPTTTTHPTTTHPTTTHPTTTHPTTTIAPPSTTSSTTTTSSTSTTTTTSTHVTSSVSHTLRSTTPKPPQKVLGQTPAPGTVLMPGTSVAMTMDVCPP